MAVIKNVARLNARLKALIAHSRKNDNVEVTVGYTANYAVFVHEVKRNYRNGEWKYLETPARKLVKELGRIVWKSVKVTKNLGTALVLAGLRLQAESQLLVPVRTGNLKASAFTRKKTNQ